MRTCLASAEVAADRARAAARPAAPRRPRRGVRDLVLSLGAHGRHAVRARRRVRRRGRHRASRRSRMAPPPHRVPGAEGDVGDRGRGRGVRAVGPRRDRRRRSSCATGRTRPRGPVPDARRRPARARRHARSATSATCRRGPSRRSPTPALICCEDTRRTGRLLAARRDPRRPDGRVQRAHRAARLGEVLDRARRRSRRRRGHRRRDARHQRPRRAPDRAPCSTPGFEVTAVPGPAAVVAGARRQRPADRPLRVRGLPAPAAAGPGASGWPSWPTEPRTIVLYEAPHRVAAHDRRPGRGVRRRAAPWPWPAS